MRMIVEQRASDRTVRRSGWPAVGTAAVVHGHVLSAVAADGWQFGGQLTHGLAPARSGEARQRSCASAIEPPVPPDCSCAQTSYRKKHAVSQPLLNTPAPCCLCRQICFRLAKPGFMRQFSGTWTIAPYDNASLDEMVNRHRPSALHRLQVRFGGHGAVLRV